ncbi:MAG TPA: AI-2E family transporter [Burkholderiaceae bacterium]
MEALSADSTSPSALPERVPAPVHARGLALGILATLALVFALQWAEKFLIPLLFGIFIAYTLNPVVVWLERVRIPRPVGSSLVILTILAALAAGSNSLHAEFESILDQLPASTHKISRALIKLQTGQPSTIQQMQKAATEIQNAAGQPTQSTKSIAQPPATDLPSMKVSEWILAGSMNAMLFLSQLMIVVFLVFFLLLSGDKFKRKLVKLTGPSLRRKKITVHILDEINSSIQKYMFMLLLTNTLLALASWVAYRLIGLENAGAWAVAAGFLHIIPYFGPLVAAAATGVTAFIQFESLSMMMLVTGVSLGLATIVGTFVATWMTGRAAKMNTAAVFISLLFWGWLWGIWGMLLGIPIIVIIKVVSEHIEGLQPVAELLGE